MALVRAIGRGVDVDGDGSEDLRRDGVVYYAQSLGGIYGTMLMGVDQRVRAGALNVPGGPILDIARQSPAFRELVAADLKNRRPGLLNGGRDGFTESRAAVPRPAGDQARARRARDPGRLRRGQLAQPRRAARRPSRRCCAARRSAAWAPRRSSTSSPTATRPSRTRRARR